MRCDRGARRSAAPAVWLLVAAATIGARAQAGRDDSLAALLDRTGRQATSFVDVISKMNCAEHVTQLKLNDSGNTVEKKESNFDYLVLLTHVGSELSLVESRLPSTPDRAARGGQAPLLLSNGFSLLFLVFHPYYAPGFEYTLGDEQMLAGRRFATVQFRHIRGTRSPAALAVRGREYQMDLEGTAFIDPANGSIARITAGLAVDMADVGLRQFLTTIDYAPVTLQADTYWLPERVTVDAQSRHQHWRNTHQFSKYKRFGVATQEQVKVP
jgi:hypothetical protein